MQYVKARAYLIIIGLWQFAAPQTFAFINDHQICSNYITAALIILFTIYSSFTKSKAPAFSMLFLGLWLSFSPLAFWESSSASYISSTLSGFITMALAFQLPGMQGRADEENGATPIGWSLNPSALGPRAATVLLALLSWFLSRYLSSYQLGYISKIWDPFFSSGSTEKVLSSSIAKLFPISDAGLGAFCYSLEVLLGLQGGVQRWRTMPWLVLLFGLLIVPAGLVSILLIILQPVVVKAYCGICILIATLMLAMVLLTLPELFAVLQLIAQRKKYNLTLVQVLFKGLPSSFSSHKDSKRMGITPTWYLLITALLGIWTFVCPSMHSASCDEAQVNFIAGPLIVAISVLSFAEVFRFIRLINILIGLWLLLAPWMDDGGHLNLMYMNSIVAILVIIFSLPKGKIRDKYGIIDKIII